MPNYTLGEIMSFATTNIGRRADIAQSDVSRLVNEAYMEVRTRTKAKEAEAIAHSSTTTGDNRLELPTDFLAPISLSLVWMPSWSTSSSVYSSRYTLKFIDTVELGSKNTQPSGTPTEAAFFNSWIELYPSPNSAFSVELRYESMMTDLLATSQVPSLSTPWRKAVELKTEEMLYDFVQDSVGADKARMRYLDYVSSLEEEDTRIWRSKQARIHVTPQYGKYGGRRTV